MGYFGRICWSIEAGQKAEEKADLGVHSRNLPFLEISMRRQGELDADQEKIISNKPKNIDILRKMIYNLRNKSILIAE